MGKQGPCCHCGISTTPLWRNGPPEKPVLCNACGSRWRTKGTLLNYMPMHSGGFGANSEGSADLKWSRGKKGSHKHVEQRSHKRKEPCDGPVEREVGQLRADQSFSKGHEEEVASRSCSGSGLSGSDISVRRSVSSTRDLPVLGPPWDAPIPSKKRSAISRYKTPVDKLSKSLTSLFLDSASAARPVPSSSSEAPLVQYNKPSLVAVEIGLGSVFVKPPVSVAQESESETSSFFMEGKDSESFNVLGHSGSGSGTSILPFHNGSDKGSALRGKDKAKQALKKPEGSRVHNEKNLIPNKALLENFPYIKRDVLQSCQSPLVFLEMKDIVNFDTFTGLLTEQEQGQLMRFISSADLARIPESLKSMFSSAQFEGALANFQHLLAEGMFDSSELGLSPRVLQHFLQLLAVTDLTGSGWMERCSQLQSRNKRRSFVDCTKLVAEGRVSYSDDLELRSLTFRTHPAFRGPGYPPGWKALGVSSFSLPVFIEFKSQEPVQAGICYTVLQNKDSSRDKLKGLSLPEAATSASGGLYGAKQAPSRPLEKLEEDVKAIKTNGLVYKSCTQPIAFHNSNLVKSEPTMNPEVGRSISEAVELESEAKNESACFLNNTPFLSTSAERGAIIGDEEYIEIGGIDTGDADSLLFNVPNPMSFQQAELLQQPSWSKTKSIKEEENDPNQLESGGLIMSNTWHMDTSPAEWGLFWNSSCVGPGRTLPNGTVLNPGRMLM